jgi:hypothetical protein
MRLIVLVLIAIGLSSCSIHAKKVRQLHLIKAFEVETQGYLEPSGLTQWDGEFYTVSDKQDKIFQLKFKQNSIELIPIISIINDRNKKLDFEGITHDENYFYLISEMYFQILKVSKDGKFQEWLPKDELLKRSGEKVGFFQRRNAYFESLCYLGSGQFLLGAEREPRGFIHYNSKTEYTKAYKSDESIYPLAQHRSTDFTGLSCGKKNYVLERNAYVVSELKLKQGKFHESRGWSYQDIIEKPELQYQDMKYGHAEGLVVKGNKFYLILDNNRNPHKQNTKNNNSLFLVLRK